MKPRHTSDSICPSCEQKLLTAHPVLVSWFHRIKTKYPNVHVAWAYRNAAEQEAEYIAKRTRLIYPHSRHNAVRDGKPCSQALDIFQIDEDGTARFSRPFYAKVANDSWENHDPIIWGGDWNGNHVQDKNDTDSDHFELTKIGASLC